MPTPPAIIPASANPTTSKPSLRPTSKPTSDVPTTGLISPSTASPTLPTTPTPTVTPTLRPTSSPTATATTKPTLSPATATTKPTSVPTVAVTAKPTEATTSTTDTRWYVAFNKQIDTIFKCFIAKLNRITRFCPTGTLTKSAPPNARTTEGPHRGYITSTHRNLHAARVTTIGRSTFAWG